MLTAIHVEWARITMCPVSASVISKFLSEKSRLTFSIHVVMRYVRLTDGLSAMSIVSRLSTQDIPSLIIRSKPMPSLLAWAVAVSMIVVTRRDSGISR